ncbi:hypothetical protein [Arachidicoccus sp.]|uniref:hypothetical protein n=1 Tax=Arachidicoccus sp. TaxID=1872624 RepID=UPI003D1A6E68
MNNHFSLKRVWLLICRQWSEYKKFYVYGTLALLGLLIFAALVWISNSGLNYRKDYLISVYSFGLLLIGAIFANNSLKMLHSKAESIYWSTIPANQAEKLICILFYNVIVFTIVYTLCCILVSYCSFSYIDHIVRLNPKYSSSSLELDWKNRSSELRKIVTSLSYAFFVVQGLFILGAVYFKKYSFIITTIIAVLLLFAGLFYMQKLSDYFSPNSSFEINTLDIYKSTYQEIYKIDNPFANTIVFILKIIGGPFLWLISWYKLKEKEI